MDIHVEVKKTSDFLYLYISPSGKSSRQTVQVPRFPTDFDANQDMQVAAVDSTLKTTRKGESQSRAAAADSSRCPSPI